MCEPLTSCAELYGKTPTRHLATHRCDMDNYVIDWKNIIFYLKIPVHIITANGFTIVANRNILLQQMGIFFCR